MALNRTLPNKRNSNLQRFSFYRSWLFSCGNNSSAQVVVVTTLSVVDIMAGWLRWGVRNINTESVDRLFTRILTNKSHLGYGHKEKNTPTAKTLDRFVWNVVHLMIKLHVKSDEQCTFQGEVTSEKKRGKRNIHFDWQIGLSIQCCSKKRQSVNSRMEHFHTNSKTPGMEN